MHKIKFVSNNDVVRSQLPFGTIKMQTIPSIGDQIKFGTRVPVGKVNTITHVIEDGEVYCVEVYLVNI